MRQAVWLLLVLMPAAFGQTLLCGNEEVRYRDGHWSEIDGALRATGGFSRAEIVAARKDFDLRADVTFTSDPAGPGAAGGFEFRAANSAGFVVVIRERERGDTKQHGPWELVAVELHRVTKDGWKILQASKLIGMRSDKPCPLRAVAIGPDIWVYAGDEAQPILREYEPDGDHAGAISLIKDHRGTASFANVVMRNAATPPATLPSRQRWSDVSGVVYVRSDAVNAVEMWADYWPHVETIDRELGYASLYGFNMAQVYLHWVVWQRDPAEYLRRLDDFVARAARHGLQVNFVLWDNCGNVAPSLEFRPPVPGRHNSQMMPNPAFDIRDDRAKLDAHRESFRAYVTSLANHFKGDDRVAFWQLYNEAQGARENVRSVDADANVNTLLGWTRDWIRAVDSDKPVTATDGPFYGSAFADFPSYHAYDSLPGAEAGPEHLCTETLNRPKSTLIDVVRKIGGNGQGFVVWELMIGRDNCRFAWGHPDGDDEPAMPFHGVIYPDGHPWDLDEIHALLGDERFERLRDQTFQVEYFAGRFERLVKRSLTPRVQVDQPDEPGAAGLDPAAGVPKSNFSVRWTGRYVAESDGEHIFVASGSGDFAIKLGGRTARSGEPVRWAAGSSHEIVVEWHQPDRRVLAKLEVASPGEPSHVLDLNDTLRKKSRTMSSPTSRRER